MKMKKLFWILLVNLIIFGGCATHKPIIFDETLAESEVATIYWCGTGNYVHPVAYNDIRVEWDIGSWGFYPIIIPAGETTFELEGYTGFEMINAINGSRMTLKYDYTGIIISYNFIKGETYTIYFEKDSLTIHSGKSYSNDTILKKFDVNFKLIN